MPVLRRIAAESRATGDIDDSALSAAVDETALAADSMSSTIAAIRSDTETVATDIDEVEKGFGRFSEQIAGFKSTAKEFVSGIAA